MGFFCLFYMHLYLLWLFHWQDCWQCIAKITKLQIGIYTGRLGMDTVKGESFCKTPLLKFITVPHLVIDLSDSEANRNGFIRIQILFAKPVWLMCKTCIPCYWSTNVYSSCTRQNIGTQCGHNLWKLSGHPESIWTWSQNRKNESP